ncbi:AMP-binding protein [Bacillus sp. S/N-304-OC-R1]|uniref:AMP-binding protein n=1 Tax=Bacillus sp. S/N-304-OC-R1 TaxID=2758034 RepID=UPI0021AE587E|nr:AMP-binding protein [Bacillus sp. S/N-304-OC-R1]
MKLMYVLYKMKLLSPTGLYRVLSALYCCGVNVMTLLHIAAKTYGNKIAIVDDHEEISFEQLMIQSEKLSIILYEYYQLKNGQKIAVLCRNHMSFVKTIFAVSRLGADIYLLNPKMSRRQFLYFNEQYQFDFLIYDCELDSIIHRSEFHNKKIYSYHDNLPAINNITSINIKEKMKVKRASTGRLILLTGGTTGTSKKAPHKPSFFQYLNPFIGMLTKLNLGRYENIYIATPLFHGYGAAVLFLFIALGKKVVISTRFHAQQACSLVRKHKVEVITVVPLMIRRMINYNIDDLRTLTCIASGSAELNPKLAAEVLQKLGNVLYNLYGTSETGLNVIATPSDLVYSNRTIGRKIVKLKILDKHLKEATAGTVGQLYVRGGREWKATGDLGYRDQNGYYFLCGRVDDMVVSAGVNVYPLELEQILISHPLIQDAAVIGIEDEEYGQRLKAFVQSVNNAELSKEELYRWLSLRAATFQIPKEIDFMKEMPYTALGKLDKKRLRTYR